MARTLTPRDGYAIMTQLVRQATGQANFAAVDASNFVSAGETVLATGTENVYNAINTVLGRLVVATRPYTGKLRTIQAANSSIYTSRYRKVSYYSKDALPSGHFNTDLYTNLADGYTSGDNSGASTKSQWEQHQAMPLEVNFGGSTVWQDCITEYEDQVQMAFRSVEDFTAFVTGYLQEHANDIESQKEAFNRMTLLAKMASIYDNAVNNNIAPESAVNLTAKFNAKFGTSYTSAQLLSTYLREFTEFAISEIKTYSKRLTYRSAKYHDPMQKTVGGVNYHILRHTPKEDQRLILYGPLITDIEARVMPEVFGPKYLELGDNFESVEFWQSDDAGSEMGINFKSAVYDHATGTQIAGNTVSLDYVVGMLFDWESVLTDFVLESARTTQLEARKGYRNTWLNIARNSIVDQSENAILFYMKDATH